MAVYAFSDLHGCYGLWQKIKEYVKPEDTLICLGDNIDCGNDGIKIFTEMRRRENTVILMGNHEDMAATVIPDLIDGRPDYDASLWFANGGQTT